MMADAAVSVPNPRQEIDLSSLFYNDSDTFGNWIQNTVFSKKLFMATCSRELFMDAALLFRMICSAKKPLIIFPNPCLKEPS